MADKQLNEKQLQALLRLKRYEQLEKDIAGAREMLVDPDMFDMAEQEIASGQAELVQIEDELQRLMLPKDPDDARNAFMEIRAGTGGDESALFAGDLLRMYTRYCERHNYPFEVLDTSYAEEAGIKSATFAVKAPYGYGTLSIEQGTHRLVRISPFNSQGKRQTAFAALKVTPFLEEVPDIEIDESKDLRIDTYRSSGAGGQHVNVTDSAVRITHLPTGVVVSCQNERSQHQNKDRAMQVLKMKLADLQRQEREAELNAIRGVQHSVGFGSQIRSYVLQPYQMVKDLRDEYETGNVEGVLDGDLDQFMEAYLRWQRAEGEPDPEG